MDGTYLLEAAWSQCLHTALILICFPDEVPETQRLRNVPKIFNNWQVVATLGCIPSLYGRTWTCNPIWLRKSHTVRPELTLQHRRVRRCSNGWGVAQLVGCLSSIQESLGWIPNTP